MNTKRQIAVFCILLSVLLAGCKMPVDQSVFPEYIHDEESRTNDVNPTVWNTASEAQDFIFNTNSVGITKITMRRSEWNKLLAYYDYFYKNENLVFAESYEYEKDGQNWKLNTVGLRLRGNTSRFRPAGKDSPVDETKHKKPNSDWNWEYYNNYVQKTTDSDYRQSHFKVDFEPFEDDDRKMSNCMKGVALKRCDSVFSREIFCYHLFHEYGIWTAPRASQTKVYINFIEDVDKNGAVEEDISACEITKIDFGVYEMFEEVNKQSLKGRMKKKNNNTAANAWENNDGDLWKCSGGNLTASSNSANNFGCERIEIYNTDKNKSQWTYEWFGPCYDLKTNKKSVNSATKKFQGFITELNNLSDVSHLSVEGIQARKDFYEKWFDVDFFIKTYAVNMLVGMDDDYWGNANNYYLYFDNGSGGSGKCYLIPFDYDNTLGCSITGDKVVSDPMKWGYNEWGNEKHSRPLLDRLLEVPEYTEQLKQELLDVSSQEPDSPWNKDNCFSVWERWRNQVEPYVHTPNIAGWPNVGATSWNDDGGWKSIKHYLTKNSNNIYEQTTINFRKWLTDKDIQIKFDLNGGTVNGRTDILTKKYTGTDSDYEAIVETPVRTGYEFIGWTKTRNGTDYKTNYNGEENLMLYASWLDVSSANGLTIYEIEDSGYEGIKICIVNLPETNFRRYFYINGKEVGADDKDSEDPHKYRKIWAYPFTEPGTTYEIYVSYSDEGYHRLEDSNHLSVIAKSGAGEFKLLNKPEYYIEKNILKWKTEPELQIGNSKLPREDNNWEEYYLIEVQSTKPWWNYQSWNYLGASCNCNFNFKEHVNGEVLKGEQTDLCFRLCYIYNSSSYGNLKLIIYDYGDIKPFNIN